MQKSLFVFILVSLIASGIIAQNCTVQDLSKIDCAFSGIDKTGCEARGCCWQPVPHIYEQYMKRTLQVDIPWCFYPAGKNPCGNLSFDGSKGPGFDQAFYDKMYSYFMANINIQGKGGVVAAPDNNTPGGSYYYHWMRDAGLSMRSFLDINDNNLNKVSVQMKAYVQWVLRVQNEPDPNGIDVRTEPKFFLPDGGVYTGGWCRPQTDGPALRSATLIRFANILIENGQEDYVKQYLWTGSSAYNGGAIKYDLDWVINHWTENGCDLWEEVRSDNFFWNRMAFQQALNWAATFATKMGDSATAAKYTSTMKTIQDTLQGHWTGAFMMESTNRQKDSSVIHAFSTLNSGYYPFDSPYIAGTIETLNNLFCISYTINQKDNNASIPGILYGRYQGDSYAGGNPWQLLTAVLGELFYQVADLYNQKSASTPVDTNILAAWQKVLPLQNGATAADFAKAAFSAGDAVLYRLYQHVSPQDGHVSEQVGRDSGKQLSAMDLTWSYANIMRALHFRNTKLQKLINPQ